MVNCTDTGTALPVGVAVLSFSVLVLATIVGIIFVLFCRGILIFVTHDGERRFRRSATALSAASNSSKIDQEQLNEKNIIHGEYVNFQVSNKKENQTQVQDSAGSSGRNIGRHIRNKSENSFGNTTSGNDIDGIGSVPASRITPRLLSQQVCGTKAKGLSYSFVDITIKKDGDEFEYEEAKGFLDNKDKPTIPPAFKDNVYDRTKRRNEAYDVTYLPNNAIRSITYDHAQTQGGTGTPSNLKQNTIK
ncbi:hypothetical protein CHS0354_002401 [Potamilus streckersoni]|uniref:Uncharacterized protein n=1 Tax=Potamilus streckersoni TaxID=2493646 RepID=A0AAE0VK70_9BIVA|nr:hypothetical protein CHS0354_002401 [Potamilus streckersoni]